MRLDRRVSALVVAIACACGSEPRIVQTTPGTIAQLLAVFDATGAVRDVFASDDGSALEESYDEASETAAILEYDRGLDALSLPTRGGRLVRNADVDGRRLPAARAWRELDASGEVHDQPVIESAFAARFGQVRVPPVACGKIEAVTISRNFGYRIGAVLPLGDDAVVVVPVPYFGDPLDAPKGKIYTEVSETSFDLPFALGGAFALPTGRVWLFGSTSSAAATQCEMTPEDPGSLRCQPLRFEPWPTTLVVPARASGIVVDGRWEAVFVDDHAGVWLGREGASWRKIFQLELDFGPCDVGLWTDILQWDGPGRIIVGFTGAVPVVLTLGADDAVLTSEALIPGRASGFACRSALSRFASGEEVLGIVDVTATPTGVTDVLRYLWRRDPRDLWTPIEQPAEDSLIRVMAQRDDLVLMTSSQGLEIVALDPDAFNEGPRHCATATMGSTAYFITPLRNGRVVAGTLTNVVSWFSLQR